VTYTILNYSLGVIIGSDKYKKIIDDNFFDALSFCKNELVKFNNISYYVYSCEEENFKNKIETFPKTVFTSKNFEYNFELNYNDLFVKINSKYYFLIIFKQQIGKNEQKKWYLGQPFYKKFTFSKSKRPRLRIVLDFRAILCYSNKRYRRQFPVRLSARAGFPLPFL
jgi:hypothetical protein